jgi:hypothetical protein
MLDGANYNNGVFDAGEPPIPGATVTLTGVTDTGTAVTRVTTTDATGFYKFAGLDDGLYNLTETQPAGWIDGKDTIGTPGGTTLNDSFANIRLKDTDGVNNNFGELQAPPQPKVAVSITPQFAPVPAISKNQLLASGGSNFQDATAQAEATYIDGLYRTLVGRPALYQEIVYYMGQLQAGVPRAQVVATLWNSPWHRRQEILTFYNTFLGRTPNEAEIAPWVNYLVGTQDEVGVAVAFLSSPEYIARNGGAGSVAVIQSLYASGPGAGLIPMGGINYWQSVLGGNGNNYAVVARTLLGADETSARVVTAYYQQLLGRNPTGTELAAWVADIHSGHSTLFNVGIQIMATDSFYALAVQASMG